MTGCERVLARLRQGPASHHELYQLGVIAHSRISNLRARGHVILCERDGDLYVYTLLSEQGRSQPGRYLSDGATPCSESNERSLLEEGEPAARDELASPSLSSGAHKTGGVPVLAAVPCFPHADAGQQLSLDEAAA